MNAPASARRWSHLARVSSFALAAFCCCTTGACTFPDITYSSDNGTSPCAVGATCAGKATSCGKQARNTRDTCEQMACDAGAACDTPACTMQLETDLAACVTECEGCGKLEGCNNPTDHCEALVNTP